ncbi:MAG: BACON domain-containing protein, partial [Acidobacteriota bacterium]|nr:BACON domain-containing protein [Acidobacteriota bacterium]
MKLLLAALAMSVPLLAQTCTYTVTPAAATLPVSATSGSFAVTTGNGCRWAVTANNSTWLEVTGPSQFLGSAPSVSFLAAANNTAQQRSATITILDANTPTGTAAATFTATQPGAQCSYALNPASAAFGVAGGPGSFQVTTNCVWQPTGASSFLTLASTGLQQSTGTLNYTVAPNTCVFGRSGSIAIGTTSSGLAPVFTLTQDGSSANMTFSPASANAGGAASDGRFTVTTGAGCAWSASSDVTWMQITGGATGAGNGAVSYHLVANTLAQRTGSIHIGNLAFTVTQAATGPPAPAIAAIESAANYRGDAVSPGEIVAIFGTNMGPAQPAP